MRMYTTYCNLIQSRDGEDDTHYRHIVREIYKENDNPPGPLHHFAGQMDNATRRAKYTRDEVATYFATH